MTQTALITGASSGIGRAMALAARLAPRRLAAAVAGRLNRR
jgi:NAD(P)-dependent dehydrogenase (short-subunit alcohol dehydrogenase family)